MLNPNQCLRAFPFCIAIMCAAATIRSADTPPASSFRFEESENKYLKLFEGDRPVLVYNFGMMSKEGAPEKFRRSSYVHPIYGLDGEVVTDDFPKDHYHHRGLFWAWVRVEVDGKTYDPWAVSGMLTKFEKWLGRKTDKDSVQFGVENGWYIGDRKVADEKVGFRIGRTDPIGRTIDVDLTIEATDKPVRIGGELPMKKGYGGFGFRFAPRQKPVVMSMADGKQPDNVIGKRSPWADYSARFGDRPTTSGIAIFIYPNNPGFPNGWLLREYGYIGLTWPGLDLVTVEPGKPLELRYRLWIHRGDAVRGRVAQAYAAYAGQEKAQPVASRTVAEKRPGVRRAILPASSP